MIEACRRAAAIGWRCSLLRSRSRMGRYVRCCCTSTQSGEQTNSSASKGQAAASDWGRWAMLASGTALATALLAYSQLAGGERCEEAKETLPTAVVYSKADVAKHHTAETGVWVTYGGGVFDITEFIAQHPGGSSKIILAAGGPLEPFWDMYAVHKKEEVLEILEEYRIGELRPQDRVIRGENEQGPFATDPPRHPALIVSSKQPFNAETPPQLATDNFLTPNELFFTRNHLPVPVVEESQFRLEVCGQGGSVVKLSLEDLKSKFEKHSTVVAIQCAGNRRSEMNTIKTVKGLNWYHNAISNAEWTGVRLRDVLVAAGVPLQSSKWKHVQFEGLDKDASGKPYGSSVPMRYVLDQDSEILLAFEMNGQPIPRDHGFPLRVIIPGIVGARNVKWLSKVIVSQDESDSHWQQNDYKGFSPNVDWGNVDFSSAPAIQELPVTSAICTPLQNEVVYEGDEIVVKGYAYSGGGRGVVRVDVSSDDGKSWHTAKLQQSGQEEHKMFSWTLWEASVPVPENHSGHVDICCKAVDTSYNCQPDSVAPVWNLRGVLNNAWHRVQVKVERDEE